MRARTSTVAGAEGAVGGHVLPGDWVSVLCCPARGAPAVDVVRRARVGAVQEKIWDPSGAPASPSASLGSNEFFLVTLILTPEQSMRVVSFSERGRLSLALLSPIDDAAAGRAAYAR